MRSRQSGFTLVELLSSLVVVSLLLSLISLTLWSIQSRNTALQRSAQTLQAKEQAAQFLQSILVNAVSYDPTGSEEAFLSGTPTSLTFFAPAPMALEDYGLLRYDITSGAQDGSPQLTLQSALPWSPELDIRSAAFKAFDDLQFAYLTAADQQGTEPQWSTTWQDQTALPLAIRVTATLRGEPNETLDMLVKLRQPIDPHCRFDSLSRACVT